MQYNELKDKLDSKWFLRQYFNGLQKWHKGKLLKDCKKKKKKQASSNKLSRGEYEFLVALFPTYLVS